MKAPEPFSCPKEWKLSPQQGRFFEAIMDADGAISRGDLIEIVSPNAFGKLIDVLLHHVRRKLAPFNITIHSVWGRGIRIDDDAKAMLRAGAIELPPEPDNPIRRMAEPRLEEMVARFLTTGEHCTVVAAAYGVVPSLPPLRAYTWGLIDQRRSVVRPSDLTEKGRAWLAARTQERAA